MQRFAVFQEYFIDIVARFKTALTVENDVDLISSLTKEFTTLLDFFGALEIWPLVSNTELTSIKVSKIRILTTISLIQNFPKHTVFENIPIDS